MNTNRIAIALVPAFLASLPLTAMADPHWRGDHRDMRHFEARDAHRWAGGHWYHGPHDGRLGWWWVVGAAVGTTLWYAYPQPVYPYPDPYVPPTVIVQPAPPAPPPAAVPPAPPASWYFCRDSGKYYPYVSTCPSGWVAVPATPPGN